MNKNCFLCDLPFDDQNVKSSREHIIPQSIGGRDKVAGFICETCNRNKGNEWDNKLAQQLGQLSLLFKIKKERTEVRALKIETSAKKKYLVKNDGSIALTQPYFNDSKQLEGNRVEISIKANDEKEAIGVVCGRGRNPTLRLWPTIFSGKIDVFPGDRRSRLISSMTSVAPA